MVAQGMTAPKSVAGIVSNVMERMASEGGLKHVYCVACGGSLGGLFPLDYLLKSESSTLRSGSITANEFVHATPACIGKNSLVVAMSNAGNTPETVAAAKKAGELGAYVVALSSKEDVPLASHADDLIVYGSADQSYEITNQALLVRLGAELLKAVENWKGYEAMIDGLSKIDGITKRAVEKAAPVAEAFSEKYKDDEVIYTMGSGPLTSLAYTTCICHLMEMEWINSSSFHSGEFFHGPFEITDTQIPFVQFISAGRTRFLDERASKFLEGYTKCHVSVDAKDFGADELPGSVEEFLEPVIMGAVARELTTTLAKAKKHPFLYRKYMFKVEY